MSKTYCANCGKEIEDGDYYYYIGDNFLQVKYFEKADGSDNIFCSQRCICEMLSVDSDIVGEEEE